QKEIIKQLKKAGVKKELAEGALDKPKKAELGDYAFPCFPLAKDWKKKPHEIAQDLARKIPLSKEIVKIQVIGPFLNFFINKEEHSKDILTAIYKEKSKFGKGKEKKKIMVEFCSPNTNKPLHLGHVRNCVIGDSVSKILDFNGNKVTKSCLVNDRGVHICKSMLAYQKWGAKKLPDIKSDFYVGKFYVMFAKEAAKSEKKSEELEKEAQLMLQKWEKGDKATITLWKKMNSWVYKGFGETYKNLGVSFDKFYYESEMYKEGKDIIMGGLKKKIFEKDETGAVIVDLEKYKLPKKVLLRSDGTSLYIVQDLFLGKKKIEDFKLDQSIHVVGSEQKMHFDVLFKIFELLGHKWAKNLYHLSYGMVYLPDGKMKSREGKIVDADDLVREMKELARFSIKERHKDLQEKEVDKRAEMIGLGAIKFFLLRTDFVKDIHYDPKESISFEGETGPYVQYTHARICSIMRKLAEENKKSKNSEKFDAKFVKKVKYEVYDEREQEIIKMLGEFPIVVNASSKHLKPSIITRYLLDLSQKANEFYHASPILKAPDDLLRARILLIHSVKQVIETGLGLLGIDAPQEM
ncbi:arginine--tRNA ligase, partial [Candidatus Woesearchaeota archaeon]|nr:arginine--tRNA ligase [Candidatus Woesearchaeota archaeon]